MWDRPLRIIEVRSANAYRTEIEDTPLIGAAHVADHRQRLVGESVMPVGQVRRRENRAEIPDEFTDVEEDNVNIAIKEIRLGALGVCRDLRTLERLDDVRSRETEIRTRGGKDQVGVGYRAGRYSPPDVAEQYRDLGQGDRVFVVTDRLHHAGHLS